MIHVTEARYLNDFTIWVRFNDGAEGEVDLTDALSGEVFEPLRDPSYFRDFEVALDTVTWPNGADFAPEFLYDRIRVRT